MVSAMERPKNQMRIQNTATNQNNDLYKLTPIRILFIDLIVPNPVYWVQTLHLKNKTEVFFGNC